MPNSFIFQFNPAEYRIWDALQHVAEHENMLVLSPHRSKQLKRGARVYFWEAGGKGLVARGTVLEERVPRAMPQWQHPYGAHGPSERVVIHVDGISMTPVSRTEINQDATLRNAPFFRNKANHGAVFSFDVPPTVLAAVDYLIDRYLSPSEVEASGDDISEGARTRMWVNRFERDPDARRLCIDKFGWACLVCGFDFRKTYGDIGTEFIHVHHLIPLHKIGKQYKVNPEKDLRPVCPNCHAMLHRGNPLLSIEELKCRMSVK